MPCTGRYAEAWEFATLFCVSSIKKGVDNSPGPGPNAFLTDTTTSFTPDIQANVGMILYNLSANTHGPVTSATATTLIATGVTWTPGQLYRIAALTGEEIASIETFLDIAATDLHAALAASGACSCNFASWATGYLSKLNCIDAAVLHGCGCGGPNLSEEMRRAYLDWISTQLELIRTGKIELCSGETGSEYPAMAWAEQSVNEFSAAEIIVKR